MSGDVIISPYRPEDFGAVLALCIEAYRPIYKGFEEALGSSIFKLRYPNWELDYENYLRTFSDMRPGKEVFVATVSGEVAGFIELERHDNGTIGELGLNAASPKHQGKGLGKAMYRFGLERLKAQGAKLAVVSTGADSAHAPARAAYERAGFDRSVLSVAYFKVLD